MNNMIVCKSNCGYNRGGFCGKNIVKIHDGGCISGVPVGTKVQEYEYFSTSAEDCGNGSYDEESDLQPE